MFYHGISAKYVYIWWTDTLLELDTHVLILQTIAYYRTKSTSVCVRPIASGSIIAAHVAHTVEPVRLNEILTVSCVECKYQNDSYNYTHMYCRRII